MLCFVYLNCHVPIKNPDQDNEVSWLETELLGSQTDIITAII